MFRSINFGSFFIVFCNVSWLNPMFDVEIPIFPWLHHENKSPKTSQNSSISDLKKVPNLAISDIHPEASNRSPGSHHLIPLEERLHPGIGEGCGMGCPLGPGIGRPPGHMGEAGHAWIPGRTLRDGDLRDSFEVSDNGGYPTMGGYRYFRTPPYVHYEIL